MINYIFKIFNECIILISSCMSYITTIHNCSCNEQHNYLKVSCELIDDGDNSVNQIKSGHIELSLKIPEEIENIINIDNKTLEIENKNIISPNSFFSDDTSPFPLLKYMND